MSQAPEHVRPLIFTSVPKAAKWSGLPEYMLRQAIRDKALPHVRRGKSIILTSTAILRWLEGNEG